MTATPIHCDKLQDRLQSLQERVASLEQELSLKGKEQTVEVEPDTRQVEHKELLKDSRNARAKPLPKKPKSNGNEGNPRRPGAHIKGRIPGKRRRRKTPFPNY